MLQELEKDYGLTPEQEEIRWLTESAIPFDPIILVPDYEELYPAEMELLRVGGVHPTDRAPHLNPYTGEMDPEPFYNTGLHCTAVTFFAGTIARELHSHQILTDIEVHQIESQALKEDAGKRLEVMRQKALARLHPVNIISPDQIHKVESRALRHDGGKRFEVDRKKAAEEGIVDKSFVYSETGYESVVPILIDQGIDPELASQMADAGRETGHNSLKTFVEIDSEGRVHLKPGDKAKKIIHLADDGTASPKPKKGEPLDPTLFLTPLERMNYQIFHTAYPFMYTEGFGFDEAGHPVTFKDITQADPTLTRAVDSYFNWQQRISNAICAEIKNLLDPYDLRRPEHFIKDLVNSRLAELLLNRKSFN